MAKRPASHINEELSRRAFKNALSAEWVIHDQYIDYGIDFKVDLFKNSILTPFSFYVQLKSISGLEMSDSPISFSFSTERISEYKESFLPVMLVIYDVDNHRLVYEWALNDDEMKRNDLIKLKRQKSITLKISKRLDEKNADELFREVVNRSILKRLIDDRKVSYKIAVISDRADVDAMNIIQKLQQWIIYMRLHDSISMHSRIESDIDSVLLFDELVSIGSIREHNLSYEYDDDVDDVTLIKILIAIQMLMDSRVETSLDMIGDIIQSSCDKIKKIEVILCNPVLALAFGKRNRAYEAFRLAEILVENSLYYSATLFSTALINNDFKNYFKSQEYRRLLHNVIEKSEDASFVGILRYNLANNLRSHSLCRAAIKNFLLAAKMNPLYLEKSYWWSELAGCFYIERRYRCSSKCYKKAIDMGEDFYQVKALMSDALIYQGDVVEAIRLLDEYIAETEYPIVEYQLKSVCWSHIKHYFTSKKRDTKLALDTVELGLIEASDQTKLILFENAIKSDPLCGLAWFNYSVVKGEENQSINWLITSILQDWDIEAWANAFSSMFKTNVQEEYSLFIFTIYQAYKLHGDSFIEYLIQQTNSGDRESNIKYQDILKNFIHDAFKQVDDLFQQSEEMIYRLQI